MSIIPLQVVVTGAAGQIAYSLLPSIANGSVFGKDQTLFLRLLDIAPAQQALEGVGMEIEDCAFPLVKGIVKTADPFLAFDSVDYAIMLGSMPRKEGMDRSDLLKANVGIFKVQGEAIDKVAKKTAKILVVGNPANTNALICQHYAKSIPAKNFSALTRLDENRAISLIAKITTLPVESIRNIAIWGNHSNTQYPDVTGGQVKCVEGKGYEPLSEHLKKHNFDAENFIKKVSLRGGEIISARKLSSAMSAAKAICDHLRDWHHGTADGKFVSMGVMSDGTYGVPSGLIFSFPVHINQVNKEWMIVQGIEITDFTKKKLEITKAELEAEKKDAFSWIASA